MKVHSSSLNTVCIPSRKRVGLTKGNLLSCARPGPIWDAHYQYLFVFLATSLLPLKWSLCVHLSSSRVKPSRHGHSRPCSPTVLFAICLLFQTLSPPPPWLLGPHILWNFLRPTPLASPVPSVTHSSPSHWLLVLSPALFPDHPVMTCDGSASAAPPRFPPFILTRPSRSMGTQPLFSHQLL